MLVCSSGAAAAGGVGCVRPLPPTAASLPCRPALPAAHLAHPSPLRQPGLGEVLLCLLGSLAAAQHLLRSAASLGPRQLWLGPWRGDGDAAPYAGAGRGAGGCCRASAAACQASKLSADCCPLPTAARSPSRSLSRPLAARSALPRPHLAACYARQAADAAAWALQDTLSVALYRLAAAFDDTLPKVLADTRGAPAFGSKADAAALLQAFLRGTA